MKKHTIYRIIPLIFLLSLIVPVAALAIPMTFTGVAPGKPVNTNHGGWVAAGIYNLEVGVEKTPYDAFCIEFDQWAPSTTQEYSFQNLSDIFSQPIVEDITKLWYTYFDEAMSAEDAAGLQIALWEVTENDNHDVSSGSFYLDSNNDYGAQSMLDSISGISLPTNVSLVALTNPDKQDYLVAAPVPEPSTMLLLGLGLVGTVVYARKKGLIKK